jgi:hypothetical protein
MPAGARGAIITHYIESTFDETKRKAVFGDELISANLSRQGDVEMLFHGHGVF